MFEGGPLAFSDLREILLGSSARCRVELGVAWERERQEVEERGIGSFGVSRLIRPEEYSSPSAQIQMYQ